MEREPEPTGVHVWWKPDWLKFECCKLCGVVRRADDKNNPCRGKVGVGPREVPS